MSIELTQEQVNQYKPKMKKLINPTTESRPSPPAYFSLWERCRILEGSMIIAKVNLFGLSKKYHLVKSQRDIDMLVRDLFKNYTMQVKWFYA